jgi:hypothetical protein
MRQYFKKFDYGDIHSNVSFKTFYPFSLVKFAFFNASNLAMLLIEIIFYELPKLRLYN